MIFGLAGILLSRKLRGSWITPSTASRPGKAPRKRLRRRYRSMISSSSFWSEKTSAESPFSKERQIVIMALVMSSSEVWSLKHSLRHPDTAGLSHRAMLRPIVVDIFNTWSLISNPARLVIRLIIRAILRLILRVLIVASDTARFGASTLASYVRNESQLIGNDSSMNKSSTSSRVFQDLGVHKKEVGFIHLR